MLQILLRNWSIINQLNSDYLRDFHNAFKTDTLIKITEKNYGKIADYYEKNPWPCGKSDKWGSNKSLQFFC